MRRRKFITTKKQTNDLTLWEMRARRKEIKESQGKQEHRWHSDEEIARALKACAGFRSEAARLLGITPSSITQRLAKSKKLSNLMDNILEDALDRAEKKLDQAINEGQPWAVMFLLRSKGRGRNWGEKSTLELQTKAPSGILLVPPQLPRDQWERWAIEEQQKLLSQEGEDNEFEDIEEGEYEEGDFTYRDQRSDDLEDGFPDTEF